MVGKVTIPYTFATMATGNVPASDLDACFTALNNGLAPPIQSYLAGFQLSNDATTPNSVLDVTPGTAADSANATWIQTSATFYCSTGGSWVAGAGTSGSPKNKMGAGLTIAASTWYHVFAIVNGGASDIYFDTSVAAANQPSGTTAIRRIGSFRTNASSYITAFTQLGDRFIWATPTQDYSSTLGTSVTQITLTVPTGVSVTARIRGYVSTSNGAVLLWSTYETGSSYNSPTGQITAYGNLASFANDIDTNANAQINGEANGSGIGVYIVTDSWIDTRGKNN